MENDWLGNEDRMELNKSIEVANLRQKLKELQNEVDNIKILIDKNNHDDKISKLEFFKNKYFKDVSSFSKNYVNCIYIYGIDEKNYRLLGLNISYSNETDYHFDVSFNPFFEYQFFEDKTWIEITRNEFVMYYNRVMGIIDKNINNF